MDIATTLNKKTKQAKPYRWLIGGLLFVSLFAFAYVPFSQVPSMKIADMVLSQVKRGDLQLTVYGYGQLKAKHQQFLTSRFQATVAEVFHYPGESVQADTVVMSLLNPQLDLQLSDALLALAQQKARVDEQAIEQESQLLERQSTLYQLESELANGKLRVEAETTLAAEGIVSELDFKRSQLLVLQLEQRIKIEQQRLEQLKQIHTQRSKIQRDLLKQYELRAENAQSQLAQLNVRAGIDGVLQTLEVEVGQTVGPGALLAQVGSDKKLKAQLRVQQREAETISLGMPGRINTFGGEATGHVTRIDPIIVEGRVLVEMDLNGQLPKNARPDLTVDGQIFTGQLQDVLYIQKPAHATAHKSASLFQLSSNRELANRTEVALGHVADNKIQVINGLSIGQEVIISDLSQLHDHTKIKISQ